MSRGKDKPGEDDGLASINYPSVNEEFYAGDPADYFFRRLQGLLILKGKPEAIQALMVDGIDAGSARLELTPGEGPGDVSQQDDDAARDRFLTADSWLLLHHASETLVRLYLAHAPNGPCPALDAARLRGPGELKRKINARLMSQRTPEHLAENGVVFYNSPTAEHLSEMDDDGRQAVLSNIEDLLRLFASVVLDAESYNGIKHSMAVRTGRSRLNVMVGDVDLSSIEGPHLEYVGLRTTPDRRVWAYKTRWLDFDLIVAQIYMAHRMILALWLMARHRYLGVELTAVPHLGSPTAQELRELSAVSGTVLTRDLVYEPSDAAISPTPTGENTV